MYRLSVSLGTNRTEETQEKAMSTTFNTKLKTISKTLCATLSLAIVSFSAHAGCGESNTICHYYKSGALVSKNKCQVTTCSNMRNPFQSFWTWKNSKVDIIADKSGLKLNGKPAYRLPSNLSHNPTCFVVIGTGEILCAEDNL